MSASYIPSWARSRVHTWSVCCVAVAWKPRARWFKFVWCHHNCPKTLVAVRMLEQRRCNLRLLSIVVVVVRRFFLYHSYPELSPAWYIVSTIYTKNDAAFTRICAEFYMPPLRVASNSLGWLELSVFWSALFKRILGARWPWFAMPLWGNIIGTYVK